MKSDPKKIFEPDFIRMFAGGRFRLDQNPATVAELSAWIRAVDTELGGWGDDTEIASVDIRGGKIDVTLTRGICE